MNERTLFRPRAMPSLLLGIFLFPATTFAYNPDDRVLLISDAKLTADDGTTDVVEAGEVLRILRVDGHRLRVSVNRLGWIDDKYVVSVKQESVDRLSAIMRASPNDTRLYSLRAVLRESLGQLDGAMSDFDEMIRIDPSSKHFGYRGMAWYRKGDHDRAIADFDQMLKLNPNDDRAYQSRALTWYAKDEYDRAISDLNAAVRLDPLSAAHLDNRGIVRFAKREYDRAISDFNEAIKLEPKRMSTYNNRGAALLAKGEYDKALADLDTAIRLNPQFAIGHVNRGVVWHTKGEYARAITDYEQAMPLDPKDKYAPLLGYLAARSAGDARAAERFLLACKPADEEWPAPIARFLRGDLKGDELLALAADANKKTAAHYYLGASCAIAGQRDQALVHFRWVREHGKNSCSEYSIAIAELRRIESRIGSSSELP